MLPFSILVFSLFYLGKKINQLAWLFAGFIFQHWGG